MKSGSRFVREGMSTSVGIELGPDVASTIHTHPQSGVGLFSYGDTEAYTKLGYAGTAEHSLLGLKWPQTARY